MSIIDKLSLSDFVASVVTAELAELAELANEAQSLTDRLQNDLLNRLLLTKGILQPDVTDTLLSTSDPVITTNNYTESTLVEEGVQISDERCESAALMDSPNVTVEGDFGGN